MKDPCSTTWRLRYWSTPSGETPNSPLACLLKKALRQRRMSSQRSSGGKPSTVDQASSSPLLSAARMYLVRCEDSFWPFSSLAAGTLRRIACSYPLRT